jgi:hypothetical protein
MGVVYQPLNIDERWYNDNWQRMSEVHGGKPTSDIAHMVYPEWTSGSGSYHMSCRKTRGSNYWNVRNKECGAYSGSNQAFIIGSDYT